MSDSQHPNLEQEPSAAPQARPVPSAQPQAADAGASPVTAAEPDLSLACAAKSQLAPHPASAPAAEQTVEQVEAAPAEQAAEQATDQAVEQGAGQAAAQAADQAQVVASAPDSAPGAEPAAGAAGASAGPQPPVFKMGDDVSAYTGRPRFTAEDNKALAQSARFFRQAMTTAARARGEEYEPFQLPAKMRAQLAKIDEESAQLKYEEALKAGLSEEEAQAIKDKSLAALSSLHAVNAEEDEQLKQAQSEQERIDAGGARFYHKYQELLERQQEHQAANKEKVKRNLKVALVVIVGLVGYMLFSKFALDKDAASIEELKAALPLTIDETTAMVRIDDRNDDFRIFFEKDPKAFEGWSEHQKQAALDQFSKNAPLLCKNQLLNHIITSGKKVTVILEATDRSFSRQYSVDQCPTTENREGLDL